MEWKKLVYEVLTITREMSDDSNITESFVKHLIDEYRSKYIQIEYSKRNMVSQISTQSFNLSMTAVDSSSTPSIVTGIFVLESEVLPELINLAKRPGIIRIRSIDGIKGDINFMSLDRAQETSYSRFKTINAYLDSNNKLYIVGNKPSASLIENIVVDAVLSTPSEVMDYVYKDRVVGAELTDYPIPASMWSFVKQEVLNDIFTSYKVPNDNVNNQIDDKELNQQQVN